MRYALAALGLLAVGCAKQEPRQHQRAASIVINPDGFRVGFEFRTSTGVLCVADLSMDAVSCDWSGPRVIDGVEKAL